MCCSPYLHPNLSPLSSSTSYRWWCDGNIEQCHNWWKILSLNDSRSATIISSTSHDPPAAGSVSLCVRTERRKKTTFHGWLGRHHTIQWLRLVAFLFESQQSMDGWRHADLCLCYDLCDGATHSFYHQQREGGAGGGGEIWCNTEGVYEGSD